MELNKSSRYKWTFAIIGTTAVMGLSGCVIEVPAEPPKSSAPTCETRYDNSIDTDVVQYQTLVLEKQKRWVNRYNCDGELLSRRHETMKDPRKLFSVEAKTLAHEDRNLSFWSYNRTTCSTGKSGLIEITQGKTGWITADMSPAFFATEVVEGPNFFDYEFSACDENPDNRSPNSCLKSEVVEKGTLILDVIYQVKNYINEEHIYPETCP